MNDIYDQEYVDMRRDAERFRALTKMCRIRNLGCAGIVNRKPDGYAHLGIELWTRHSSPSPPEAADWLIQIADIAREVQKG